MTVLVVRHARAGSRHKWIGDDRLRPLSRKGRAQADALAATMSGLLYPAGRPGDGTPVRIFTSPWLRCRQTVRPLAAALGVKPVIRDELGEGMDRKASVFIDELVSALNAGPDEGAPAVVCTHGDVITEVLDDLRRQGVDLGPEPALPKGSTWVLETQGGRVSRAVYVPPPDRA